MNDDYYTHATWRVQDSRQSEFIEAWRELGEVFASLEGKPLWGTLVQSVAEPTLFISFGPWQQLSDIEAMRADPKAREAMAKIRRLCVDATPGAYRLVAHAPAGDR